MPKKRILPKERFSSFLDYSRFAWIDGEGADFSGITPPPACPKTGILPEADGGINAIRSASTGERNVPGIGVFLHTGSERPGWIEF